MTLFASPSARPAAERARLVALLATATADGLALYLAASVAHWNVRGPHFGALHPLFGSFRDALAGYVDELAERAATLGGLAVGTVEQLGAATTVEAYPPTLTDGVEHVRALSERLGGYLDTLRAARAECADMGASDTYDLLTDVIRGLDKWGWQLIAHVPGRAAPEEPEAATPEAPSEGSDAAAEVKGG